MMHLILMGVIGGRDTRKSKKINRKRTTAASIFLAKPETAPEGGCHNGYDLAGSNFLVLGILRTRREILKLEPA
jgi:hypothetical protein